MGRIKEQVKWLEVTLRDTMFYGEDPINLLTFLGEFSRECNTLEAVEGQAYIALSYLFKGT